MPKKFELDDFLPTNQEVDIGIKINPKARIVDFAEVRLTSIDRNLKGAIEWHIENTRNKLKKLQDLLNQ